jgi:hypothetical protein
MSRLRQRWLRSKLARSMVMSICSLPPEPVALHLLPAEPEPLGRLSPSPPPLGGANCCEEQRAHGCHSAASERLRRAARAFAAHAWAMGSVAG